MQKIFIFKKMQVFKMNYCANVQKREKNMLLIYILEIKLEY